MPELGALFGDYNNNGGNIAALEHNIRSLNLKILLRNNVVKAVNADDEEVPFLQNILLHCPNIKKASIDYVHAYSSPVGVISANQQGFNIYSGAKIDITNNFSYVTVSQANLATNFLKTLFGK